MSFLGKARAWVGEKIGGVPLREQFGISGGEIHDIDEEDFRVVTQRPVRDLTQLKREKQLRLVWDEYLKNPLAFRAVEITKDFVIGDGITFKAREERVQMVLDEFWEDPVNAWDLKQFDRAKELGLYGEQIYPAHVDKESGRVRLSYIDPLQVTDVLTDPRNVEVPRKLLIGHASDHGLTSFATEGEPERERVLNVINVDDDPNSPTHGKLVGDAFFFTINKVSNAVRGNSDLLSSLDWLDTYDSFLWGIHEGASEKMKVVWDVLVKGASETKIKELQKKYGRVKSGSVRVHNESVETTAISANLQTADLAEHAKLIKNHIASGVGLPPTWLAEGGDSNRSTAAEMGVPTTKRLRSRQIFFKNMLKFIFDFVIDQAIIAKRLKPDIDRRFVVLAPQVWAIDTQTTTASLLNATNSLQIAVDNGWIENDEASQLWRFIASQLGMSVGTGALERLVATPHTSDHNAPSDARFADKHLDSIRKLDKELQAQDAKRNGGTET